MSITIARSATAAGVAFLLGLTAAPLLAHHNLIVHFATNKPISLTGTLTKIEWVNPHGWIHLTVKNTKGQDEEWAVETGNPLAMERRGLKRTDFKPGVELIVGGFAAKDGSRTAAGLVVTFPEREKTSPGSEASFTLGR